MWMELSLELEYGIIRSITLDELLDHGLTAGAGAGF